jgi:AcrR family transcriptional regulator
MASGVKRRKYDSPRRRAQAEATRAAILDAAQRLFVAQGYAATSVPAIATEADVAVKTVYLIFETKAGLVRALWDARLSPDEAQVPVLERAWYRELAAEPDAAQKLRLAATQSRQVKTRSGALMEMIRNAAASDVELAALWDDIEAKLVRVQGAIVEQLAEHGELVDGLSVQEATDVLWTLNHPTVWQLLVNRRHWSPQRYERWLGDTLCSQLLHAST